MKTLIELYDERPIENVLGTEMFRPEKTVFICPFAVANNDKLKLRLREFMRRRGILTELEFRGTSLLDAEQVYRCLMETVDANRDCTLDISGGTDAALFAGGQLYERKKLSVYTYSRRQNTFYEIHDAPFADHKKCDIRYDVTDTILMAGGSVRMGRVDNGVLDRYMDLIEPMFDLYMRFRREWVGIVTYMQRISQDTLTDVTALHVAGDRSYPAQRGKWVTVNEDALRAMQETGLISSLDLTDDGVEFTFYDAQVRTWLRDIGSVLELYVYKQCLESGVFNDVRTSVVVDWAGDGDPDAVTNEIDVMATRGVMPLFVSCKTCDVKTEALNELAVLRDRFGGQMSRAAIVTAEYGRPPMRSRAAELGIEVIDLNDLRKGPIADRLAAGMVPYHTDH